MMTVHAAIDHTPCASTATMVQGAARFVNPTMIVVTPGQSEGVASDR
jgi:hypothetical protein